MVCRAASPDSDTGGYGPTSGCLCWRRSLESSFCPEAISLRLLISTVVILGGVALAVSRRTSVPEQQESLTTVVQTSIREVNGMLHRAGSNSSKKIGELFADSLLTGHIIAA